MSTDARLPLTSLDIAADRLQRLKEILPEVFTEGQVDFERLRQALGERVETGRERYGLNWAGKAEAVRTLMAPGTGTLRPCPQESVDFDASENLIIEGDNLEVLKLLQKSYYGKVKLIYIDPPYNTGNDFIYADDFRDTMKAYQRFTGQLDEEGNVTSSDKDRSGRFHSNWLSRMYPRLHLARNLLREDGVVMISIDDTEVSNLRHLCNEVFGEENMIASLVWEKGRKNDAKLFSIGHEYILVFAKSLACLRDKKTIWREEKPGAREIWDKYLELRVVHGEADSLIETDLQSWFSLLPKNHPSKKWSRYKRVDKNGPWRDRDISWPGGGGPKYDVIHPITGVACAVPEAGWRFADPREMDRQIRIGLVAFRDSHAEPPFRKAHIKPIQDELSGDDIGDDDSDEFASQVRGSYFYKQSQVAVKDLRSLFGFNIFDNPKDPYELLKIFRYVMGSDTSGLIMDFFGGSGTTAQAVLDLNESDDGNRKFILVQLPEATDKPEYPTIAHITRERVRRVITRIQKARDEKPAQGGLLEVTPAASDLGFRALRLDASNFQLWDGEKAPAEAAPLAEQLALYADNLVAGRSEQDILFELLLKSGLPLSVRIEPIKFGEQDGYCVSHEDKTYLFCLANPVQAATLDVMRALRPVKAVCLDVAFAAQDDLKANTVLQMRDAGIRFLTA